jgi:hypothetical protein
MAAAFICPDVPARRPFPVHPYLLLVLAGALALCAPLLDGQWFHSHEQESYVLRTVEWAAGLQRGRLYPRWCPDFYGGYGSPFFLFYAPLVYAAAGGLAAFVTGPIAALKVVIAAASVLAGVGVYALVHVETRRPAAALVAAAAYLAAPYRICDLYVRGDLAEYTALGLLPLAIALYRAAALSVTPRRAAVRAGGAALCHALLILSHTLLGLWGTAVITLVLVATAVQLVRRRSGRRLLVLAAAFTSALALSAVYTVPAFVYRPLVRIDAMVTGSYDPSDNWLRLPALLARGTYQVAPLLLLAAGLVALALVRERRGLAPAGWLALAVGLTALTLPVASGLWGHPALPLLRFIQFPWRLLGPASLAAAVAAGLAFDRVITPGRTWWSAVAPALSVALVAWLGWPCARPHLQPATNIARDPESIRSALVSTTGVDEYLPRAVAGVPAGVAGPLVRGLRDARLEEGQSAGDQHLLSIETSAPGAVVALALHDFPGWRLATRSGPAPALLAATGGLLEARMGPAGRYELSLVFGPTPLVLGAELMSLLALVLTGPALLRLARP